MNSAQKMLSEKGKLIFIVNKFKFSFHKLLQNGQHRYKCTKRGCTANLKVLENHDIVWTSCNLEHNHDADEENKIERQIISNYLRRKATENMCERLSKLLHSYLRENNTNAITTKDVTYIKHNIFQARASLPPNLPRSSQEVYDILKDMNVKTYEESIYVDFEIAIHNTINDVWTLTKVRGCRFHLGQSWYKAIQKFGLSSEYVQNTEIGQYLTYIFGLPFLDPQSVGDCFSDELAEILPMNEKLTKFNDYLVENFTANDSTFPPEIWAEKSNIIHRTTNSCESFHSKFNSQFYSPHPNIFNFLNILFSIQSDTRIIIRSSNTTKPHRKEIRDKIKFLENEISKYDTGVHRVLGSRQSPWLAPYIALNTEMRA
ncbi:hypothetical protein AGLY_014314 [Aphis glycines]|uniref:FLYWCH-type domain-containing protein n=1 Tax=Aphis glycines TaxID=307491 RepID=A0A6G0T3M9_APHGL|nr:hypothetical protein AGLY_014314 [Aphis glycines]